MKYQNETAFRHDAPESLGVLMLNLGTPEAPTGAALRTYLAEFLSDPRVVEMPRLLWWLVLNGIILRVRPRRVAKVYASVWTAEGSPLKAISLRQAAVLQERLSARLPGPVRVELAMRYGNPSIAAGLTALRAANARRVLVLPLYPQYSGATTASTFDGVTAELRSWRWVPELRFVNQYHDDPAYIAALAESARTYWTEHGQPDRLLFSFHGIPKEYFLNGDPYHCQCQKTARLVAKILDLPDERWQISFQSRIGNKEWLQPYTDETLKSWGRQGVAKVHVICPGFSADCLETLEEIVVENRDYFLGSGGREYGYIPALNDAATHMDMLAALVQRHASGWPEAAGDDGTWNPAALAERLERARIKGAET